MSWSAWLIDDRGHDEGNWGYTHNTNGMIAMALHRHECWQVVGPSWWKRLDGMTGTEGKRFLDGIIGELRRDPDAFKAMNPSNGWGDYADVLGILEEMSAAVPSWPTTWSVSG